MLVLHLEVFPLGTRYNQIDKSDHPRGYIPKQMKRRGGGVHVQDHTEHKDIKERETAGEPDNVNYGTNNKALEGKNRPTVGQTLLS